jgi:hypothetical protein
MRPFGIILKVRLTMASKTLKTLKTINKLNSS